MENGLTMTSTDKSKEAEGVASLQDKLGYGPQGEASFEEGPLGQGGQPAVSPPEEPDSSQPRPTPGSPREGKPERVDLNDEPQVRALCAELYVAPIEIARAVAAVGNDCSAVRMYLQNKPR